MTIKIHDLKPAPGAKQPSRRVGRGIAGKGGKTAGRGMKGTGARANVKPGFEGGQTPLTRRVPKAKGFRNPFRVEYHVVNLATLDGFEAGAEVTPEGLRARGLVAKRGLVKVLGRGELTKALTVRAHAFSASARDAITAAGGRTEVIPPPWGDRRPPAGSNNALTNR
jgi:large subunit ribosomal protein L15